MATENIRLIYLTDLDHCQPQSALSTRAKRGHWRTLEYKTDGFSGAIVIAGDLTGAPEIVYPLRREGWYAISIGVMHQHRFDLWTQVKLSGDPTFSLLALRPELERVGRITGSPGRWAANIQELFWKVADLTGQDIIFTQLCLQKGLEDEPGVERYAKTAIAYIKLTPLSADQVSALHADRQRSDTRRLFAHNDATSYQCSYLVTTAEDIQREIEPFRDTDFSRLYWEAAYGDLLAYLGEAGRLPTYDGVDDFFLVHERQCAHSWRVFRDQGIDQLKVATDYAHQIGLELHAGVRMAGFYFNPWAEDTFNSGSIYYQRQEHRGMARDGSLNPRLSYAYPETRTYMLSVLREIAQYPVDGIGLLYVRRPPLLDYEPPLVQGFMAEYGQDPRLLDERDPRWLAYRCRVLTGFMKDVRQMLDAEAQRQGRGRFEISVVVSGREEENLFNAMDLPTWIAERLVDTVIPYTMAPRLNSAMEAWSDPRDLNYWLSLTHGTRCTLAPNLLPRFQSQEEYRRKADAMYAAGAKNLFFWDCNNRASYNAPWDTLRRLGHREEIAAWMQAGQPALPPAFTLLRELGGWNMTYDTPG